LPSLCVGYIFTLWEHLDRQKRKSMTLIELSCFPSSFSIVTLLGHLDGSVHSLSCQGTNSSVPVPPLPPPTSSSPPSQKSLSLRHEKAISMSCCSEGRLPAVFALGGGRHVLAFAGWTESGGQSWRLPAESSMLCRQHAHMAVEETVLTGGGG